MTKIVATIEARMTSSRLPGKMMLPIGGRPVLGLLIDRLKRVDYLDAIVLATTTNATDDVLEEVAKASGIETFRGSENDVLGRVVGALDSVDADICIEITGDCPLVVPEMVTAMIDEFTSTRQANAYVANTTGPTLGAPHGLDVQVFDVAALRRIEAEHREADAREHVSVPFYQDGANSEWRPRFVSFYPEDLCRSLWLSLDYDVDYALLREVHEALVKERGPHYGADDLIAACIARPAMTAACFARRTC